MSFFAVKILAFITMRSTVRRGLTCIYIVWNRNMELCKKEFYDFRKHVGVPMSGCLSSPVKGKHFTFNMDKALFYPDDCRSSFNCPTIVDSGPGPDGCRPPNMWWTPSRPRESREVARHTGLGAFPGIPPGLATHTARALRGAKF